MVLHKKSSKATKSAKSPSLIEFIENNLLFGALYGLVFFVGLNLYMHARIQSSSRVAIEFASTQTVLAAEDVMIFTEPVLTDGSFSFPILSAQGALVKDVESGKVLFEKTPDVPLLPASTVKLMTALVTVDYIDPNTVITVPAISVEGQKMGLVAGEQITVSDLTKGLLIFSANDAAEVLAETYEGGREAFIERMNEKARAIGLQNTVFSNPTGLDGVTQVTTARDLANLAEYALSRPVIAATVQQKSLTVESVDGLHHHSLANTNVLLGRVEGVLGVKTGWTENARENLVTYVDRNGQKIITVILGSQDRFGESEELIEWVYDTYLWF